MIYWQPTLKWHLFTLGILLVVCGLAYGMLCWASAKLPAPYQPRTTAQDTTPWNHYEEL